MALPVPLPRGTRPRARHYYQGFVDKRGPGDQGYRRVWAGLRGLKLAFHRGPQDHEVPGLLRAGSPGLGAPHGLSRPDPRGFSGPGPPRDPPRLETSPGWDPSGWDPQDKNLWVGLGGLTQARTSGICWGWDSQDWDPPHPVRAPEVPLPQGGTPVPPPQAGTVW
ncbi:signal-transducing adaptor protein 2 [Haemorhous mexicanus]|uniref:signal-transducing adaptor protein 2 n=1 Tax=Haemorhous mexicanus TaxID=30427 RepID=UPI0028BF277B|nr:signal-transducing adaptor protein 2 [Haemorhous mexicanus]